MTDIEILPAEQDFLTAQDQAIHQKVAVCAYFKAEKRGFSPGHALDDWLEAEAEIDTQEAIVHLEPEE